MQKKLFIIISVFSLSLISPVIQAKMSNAVIDSLYTDAYTQMQAGHLVDAIKLYEAIEQDQSNYKDVHEQLVKAYKYLGILRYERYQYEAAIDAWKHALKYDPGNEDITTYILRSIREIKVLKNIDIDSTQFLPIVEEPELKEVKPKPDTVRIYIPEKTVTEFPSQKSSYRSSPLIAGIAVALTSRTNPGTTVNKNGLGAAGALIYMPSYSRFGFCGRYEYSRFNYSSGIASNEQNQYLSLSGFSVAILFRLFTWENSSWYTFGGIGQYEMTRFENDTEASFQFSNDQETAYSTGIGVRFSHSFLSSGLEVRYLKFSDDEISDMLYLSLGIFVG